MNRLTRYHALGLMALILLVAAALRLPNLTTVPPGVHYDEAAYGVNAIDIAFRGARPVFIPDFTGREPLYLYLVAGMMRLLGPTLFALRLTSAFIGLLTVAATYWLGRELLADRRAGLLAAALLAISFWHLLFSHLGFRVISLPLLQALSVAALFRALRGRRLWFFVAGVLIGLTAYTYLASRLFPFVLLAAAIPLVLSRENGRLRRYQLVWTAILALLVAAPLLIYFINHPDTFWTRISQVAPGAESLSLWQSFGRSLGMFFLSGDPYLRFNIPSRPLFNVLWGGLMVVGWVYILRRLRRPPYDWQRAALALLAAAPIIMLLPTALAVNEIVPSNLRALGLIPFVFYLPAVGLVVLLVDLERRFGRPPVTLTVNVVVLMLLISGALTYDLYHNQWARERELVAITDGDLTAAATYLDQTLDEIPPEARPRVYVAAAHYRHPTLAFLSGYYDDYRWLPGSAALVLPADGPALYLFPLNSPAPDWAQAILGAAAAPEIITDRGRELFRVYPLESPPTLDIPAPAGADLPANFDNRISLLGYAAAPGRAGETLPLTLYWRVADAAAPGASAAVPFVHLEDAAGHRWSQTEPDAYPAEQWSAGETIIQRVELPLPAGLPPGAGYSVRIGLFDPADGRRLSRIDAAGRYAGDSVVLGGLETTAGDVPSPLPVPPFPLDEPAGPGLRLLGYERSAAAAETGETVGLALWWLADQPQPPLTLRLSLAGPAGDYTLYEGQPAYGAYPFERWTTPGFVIDRQTATIPDAVPAGAYRYRAELLDAAGTTIYAADLGPLTVAQTERTYDLPPFETPVGAVFGGEIELVGYTLAAADEPGSSDLTLVWRAAAQPTRDYTVFVHLLNGDGTCCAWQSDAMPRGGSYPTTRWRPDEVVSETYTIRPPGGAAAGPLEIGLYLAETGERLPFGPGQDALRLGE